MSNMGSTLKKPRTKRPKIDVPYKGVRMRTWGTWVSEIRKPLSKERIWLGSFDAPEKAARAYDAALYLLRGSKGKFNFPGEERPEVPDGDSSSLSTSEIKEVAAKFASPGCMPDLSSTSPLTMTDTPGVEDGGTIAKRTIEIGDSPFGVDAKEYQSMFSDSYLLDVPITHEPDSIWALLDEINQFNEAK